MQVFQTRGGSRFDLDSKTHKAAAPEKDFVNLKAVKKKRL